MRRENPTSRANKDTVGGDTAPRPLVFKCPSCGKQNLVSPERLNKAREVPVKCWVCGTEFAYEELLNIKNHGKG